MHFFGLEKAPPGVGGADDGRLAEGLVPGGVSVLIHFLEFFGKGGTVQDVQRGGDGVLACVYGGAGEEIGFIGAGGGVRVEDEALHWVFGLFLGCPGVAEVAAIWELVDEAERKAVRAEACGAFALVIWEWAVVL